MKNVILITGGTGTLGEPLVKHFLSIGYTVIRTCAGDVCNDDGISLMTNDNKLLTVKINFFEDNAVEKLIETIKKYNLEPKYLINNARDKKTLQTTASGAISKSNFEKEYYMQVVIPYILSCQLAKDFKTSFKAIVNVGSIYGITAVPSSLHTLKGHTPIHYSVAKSALIHLTKELASRWGKKGIRVNCISIGGIESNKDSEISQVYKSVAPLNKMLNVHDLVKAFEFLLFEDSCSINGHNLVIDEGWTIV